MGYWNPHRFDDEKNKLYKDLVMYNRVELIGNLGADPELKETANGHKVTTLSVATTKYVKDGENKTEWHRVVLWNKNAETAAKYLQKGSKVFIEGELATRSWEDKNGEKRYTTEINGTRFLILSEKQKSKSSTDSASIPDDTIPF